ncbi:hypothetical protein Q5752_000136 [Cryptotrichosporon argae]
MGTLSASLCLRVPPRGSSTACLVHPGTVPLLPGSDRVQIARGAYVVHGADTANPELTIVATGAEVARVVNVADALAPLRTRVVSMPSQKHFDAQPEAYRHSVLPSKTSLIVALEAWGSYGWARYARAGAHMHTFSMSAPQQTL